MSFQVEQDCEEPKEYTVVDAATLLNKVNESVLQFDMKAGILSVPRSVLGEQMAPAADAPDPASSDSTSYTHTHETMPFDRLMKNFTAVEWGVGDERVYTPVSALMLLNVTVGNKLFLCSHAAELAGAVNMSVGHDAMNRAGREVSEQRPLDCGTLTSESFCIVGQPPPHWSARGSAVLVAAHWTPRFLYKANNTMLVCAQIGRPLLDTQTALSPPVKRRH